LSFIIEDHVNMNEHMALVEKELKALSQKLDDAFGNTGHVTECSGMKLQLDRQKLELDAERELKRMKTTECDELKAKLSVYRERQEQKIDAAVNAREKTLVKQHFERESDLIDKLGTAEARVQDVKESYAILETDHKALKKAMNELKRKLAAARAGHLEESEESDEKEIEKDDDDDDAPSLYAAAMDSAAGGALMGTVMANLRAGCKRESVRNGVLGLASKPSAVVDAIVHAVHSWDKGTLRKCVADAVALEPPVQKYQGV
jgi:hypothetical protein